MENLKLRKWPEVEMEESMSLAGWMHQTTTILDLRSLTSIFQNQVQLWN